MTELFQINDIIKKGFSLITADKDKKPLNSWKDAQSKAISEEDFKHQFNQKGEDGVCGIVTGFSDLEVMDVDLKVFSTAREKIEWFKEYISFLEDNIMNFNDKFVIYKTKNEGYHILYKTKRVEGNLKIAKLKDHKQQILETRGVGGYVVVYANSYNKKTYLDIDYISDSDREVLFAVSKSYNYIDKVIEQTPKKEKNSVPTIGLTPWEDYNSKVSILDIIGSDFDVVRRLKDKTIIRRHGADSAHSGYVYHDTGLMYLFTSGTSFEAEKGYSPFAVYTHLIHNNDFTEASRDLYAQGYGDRQLTETPKEIVEDSELNLVTEFPLDIFPKELQVYIKACNESLNNSVDYMACSLLFLTSIIIGNSLQLEVKRGWRESANIWLSLVGKAGVGKTPSISSVTFPLSKLNNIEILKHIQDEKRYEAFMNMSEKEKAISEKISKPKKTQFIVNDVTLEALVELHNENTNGIGVLKDELAGFFKDMNKYREGGDLEHWLSSWSGKEINLNRKTAKSSFVERAFLPIMGGIQPSILDAFHTEENKDNGFLDRMLFSYPDMDIDKYSEKEMSQEVLDWYSTFIVSFYQSTQRNLRVLEGGTIDPVIAKFTPQAKKEWIRIFNEITDVQNGDSESESMKSMLPKQKAYICRFSLLINTLEAQVNKDISKDVIEADSVLKAERLSRYFIDMNKKLKIDSVKRNKLKNTLDPKKDTRDNFEKIYRSNKKTSMTEIASILGVSRQTIYRYKKEFETKIIKL